LQNIRGTFAQAEFAKPKFATLIFTKAHISKSRSAGDAFADATFAKAIWSKAKLAKAKFSNTKFTKAKDSKAKFAKDVKSPSQSANYVPTSYMLEILEPSVLSIVSVGPAMHENPLSKTAEATEQDGMFPEEDCCCHNKGLGQKTFGPSPVLATCV